MSISGGSNGKGLSRSDGVVRIELLYDGACKLWLLRNGPISSPSFCSFSNDEDGGGDMGGCLGDLGGVRKLLSRLANGLDVPVVKVSVISLVMG